jgi:hypothetical protein
MLCAAILVHVVGGEQMHGQHAAARFGAGERTIELADYLPSLQMQQFGKRGDLILLGANSLERRTEPSPAETCCEARWPRRCRRPAAKALPYFDNSDVVSCPMWPGASTADETSRVAGTALSEAVPLIILVSGRTGYSPSRVI